MSSPVIHPGDKVTITLSLDGQDLSNSNELGNKSKQEESSLQKQIFLKKADTTSPVKPPLVTRRTSSLLKLNIEGLLVVPELEIRLRRNSYGGKSVHDERHTEVDPSDGMLTTSLCTTELWWTLIAKFSDWIPKYVGVNVLAYLFCLWAWHVMKIWSRQNSHKNLKEHEERRLLPLWKAGLILTIRFQHHGMTWYFLWDCYSS